MKHVAIRLFFVALSVGIFIPQKTLALDRTTVLVMQQIIDKAGFSVGEADGKIGPATRRGFKAFAAAYGISEDPEAIFDFLTKKNRASRVIVDDPTFVEKVTADVSQSLKDPSSAMVRGVFRIGSVVCGEVNGKNSYGAYAGYTWFIGFHINVGDYSSYSTLHIDSDIPLAKNRCSLTIPES